VVTCYILRPHLMSSPLYVVMKMKRGATDRSLHPFWRLLQHHGAYVYVNEEGSARYPKSMNHQSLYMHVSCDSLVH
jgi:hypothetical protein